MVTRKSPLKSTIIDTPFVETVTPQAASPDQEAKAFTAYLESLLANMPSWKRVLCAGVLSLAGTAAVGYVGGLLCAYLVVGALMCGAPLFIAQVLYILALIITFYASYRAGGFLYLKVIDKTVDAQFAKAKGWVTGMFRSAPKGVAA